MTAFVLTLIGALLACGLEMLEALAIVLAVGFTRRFRDAILGAAGAGVALAVLAVVLGPLLIARVPLAPLRIVIGAFLLLFGLEWLRKGVLRLAHLRSPSDSFKEFVEEQEALEALALPAPGEPDWPARDRRLQGRAAGGRRGDPDRHRARRATGRARARADRRGRGAGRRARGRARPAPPALRLPETHLKYVVGVVLSSFGAFFAAEGLGRRVAAGRRRAAVPGGVVRARVPGCRYALAGRDRRRPDALAAQARLRRDHGRSRSAWARRWGRRARAAEVGRDWWQDSGGFLLLALVVLVLMARWRRRTGGASRSRRSRRSCCGGRYSRRSRCTPRS